MKGLHVHEVSDAELAAASPEYADALARRAEEKVDSSTTPEWIAQVPERDRALIAAGLYLLAERRDDDALRLARCGAKCATPRAQAQAVAEQAKALRSRVLGVGARC